MAQDSGAAGPWCRRGEARISSVAGPRKDENRDRHVFGFVIICNSIDLGVNIQMSNKKLESRRNFLKGTTAVATGAALMGGLNLGLARTAHAAGSDEIKIALIGCGGRGNGAANDNLKACENTKIVAVADAFENSAKGAAETLGVAEGKDILGPGRLPEGDRCRCRHGDPGHSARLPPGPLQSRNRSRQARVHGKALLRRRSRLSQSARDKRDWPTRRDSKSVLACNVIISASYVNGIAQLHNGKLGDLILLQAYWNGGGIWWRDAKEGYNEMQKQVDNWYHYCWLSGDNICEQHVHNLDVCNWAKNAHPVEANGMGGDKLRRMLNPETQIFDHHFVEFIYPDGYQDVQSVPARRRLLGDASTNMPSVPKGMTS